MPARKLKYRLRNHWNLWRYSVVEVRSITLIKELEINMSDWKRWLTNDERQELESNHDAEELASKFEWAMEIVSCTRNQLAKARGMLYSVSINDYTKEELDRILEETAGAKSYYNSSFGDDKVCECGHTYYRHFDSYEDMDPIGCKYCQCYTFKE